MNEPTTNQEVKPTPAETMEIPTNPIDTPVIGPPPTGGRRGGKVSEEEWEERITFTAKLLAKKLYKSDVKRVICRKYDIKFRQAEDIITAAKKLLVEMSGRPKEEHRLDSLAFYEDLIRDPNTSVIEKLSAQNAIDRLLNLMMPDDDEGSSGGTVIQIVHSVVNSREEAQPETLDVTPRPALPDATSH